jgi:glycosyltransferase involved in cell wall biosynthesis
VIPLKKGTLSVVVPNYNHAHYLPEALQAILDQSCRPLEVIVIDDCSTDNSVEVIEGFARKDPIVRLYRNEQNQGVIFSLNRGLNLAVGEYVLWGAADDRVCPGFFEKSMELLAQYPQAGLCSALLQLLGEKGEDKGRVRSPVISQTACFLPPEKVLATLTRYGFWFTGQTTICRRDAVLRETGGFMPELCHHTDQFVDMVVALKYGACFIPEILATWRVLDSGYAETMFNNVELSRATFDKMTQLMRSPKYAALFTEEYTKIWEWRGRYGLEMRHARRLLQDQIDFLGRLRELRPKPTFLDRVFFAVLKLLAMTGGLVAKAYLWHRRVNWDFSWLAKMLRSSYSGRAHRNSTHRK